MLTDTEARDLLHAAADTIEVDPAQPLPVVHRPLLWPMLVAAVAVIAVVAATLALADRGTEPLPPSGPPNPRPSLAANVVPAVIGLDPDDAEALLTKRGLDVRVAEDMGCPGNVAMGTEPAVGDTFKLGDKVVLRVMTVPPGASCVIPPIQAWQFLRFALGVEPAPRFGDQVTLFVGESDPVTITGEEAADAVNWEVCSASGCRSALRELAFEAQRAYPRTFTNGREPGTNEYDSEVLYSAPYLTVRNGTLDAPTLCLPAYPDAVVGRIGTSMHLEVPTDGIFCPTLEVTLLGQNGAIDAVVVRGEPAA